MRKRIHIAHPGTEPGWGTSGYVLLEGHNGRSISTTVVAGHNGSDIDAIAIETPKGDVLGKVVDCKYLWGTFNLTVEIDAVDFDKIYRPLRMEVAQ